MTETRKLETSIAVSKETLRRLKVIKAAFGIEYNELLLAWSDADYRRAVEQLGAVV